MANVDFALAEQIFHIAKRKWKADVHHHRKLDDLGGCLEVAKWIRGHQATLAGLRYRLNRPVLLTMPVNVIIRFSDPYDTRQSLGDGYRLEVEIVVWEEEDALTIPSSALIRSGEGWSVFVVQNDKAQLVPVEAGRNNGQLVQIIDGIEAGERIILYPGPDLAHRQKVEQRD